MTTNEMRRTTRRRFIKTGAAGLAAASSSGLAAASAGGSEPPTAGSPLANAVLGAFKTHQLVGLGEIHDLQNHGDALALLLSDPRLPGVVDDIVVEFGNALYQDTIDSSSTASRSLTPTAPSLAQYHAIAAGDLGRADV